MNSLFCLYVKDNAVFMIVVGTFHSNFVSRDHQYLRMEKDFCVVPLAGSIFLALATSLPPSETPWAQRRPPTPAAHS